MDTSRFQFQHLLFQKEYQHTPHFHDVNEIIFSNNDAATFLLNRNAYPLHRGSLVFVARGALHQKYNALDGPIDSYVLHYDPLILKDVSSASSNLYAAFAGANTCLNLTPEALESIYPLFRQFLTTGNDFGSDIYFVTLLVQILLRIYPLLQQSTQDDSTLYFRDDAQLAPLLDYIDSHLSENLTLDHLASHFFTSKYTMCHSFKRKTGLTIVTYVNMNRIRLSCILLKQGVSVQETAIQSGFSSSEHFIRVFSKYVGTTPGRFLQSVRESRNIPIHPAVYQPEL